MTHYQSDEIGVAFDLPDEPTALQVIRYDSKRLEMAGEAALVILWECVKPVITGWQCEAMPDKDTPLEKVTDLRAAQAVEYAAFRGSEWRLSLDTVPKNS